VTWRQFCWHATRGLGPDAIEQLGPGDERNAETGSRQQHASIAWIILHIVDAAFDRADGDGIGDKIGPRAS
jgi:hypothetical protein